MEAVAARMSILGALAMLVKRAALAATQLLLEPGATRSLALPDRQPIGFSGPDPASRRMTARENGFHVPE
jgi:hypothetical protein